MQQHQQHQQPCANSSQLGAAKHGLSQWTSVWKEVTDQWPSDAFDQLENRVIQLAVLLQRPLEVRMRPQPMQLVCGCGGSLLFVCQGCGLASEAACCLQYYQNSRNTGGNVLDMLRDSSDRECAALTWQGNGMPVLPFTTGSITVGCLPTTAREAGVAVCVCVLLLVHDDESQVTNLGSLTEHHLHNKRYLFPVGYTAERFHSSSRKRGVSLFLPLSALCAVSPDVRDKYTMRITVSFKTSKPEPAFTVTNTVGCAPATCWTLRFLLLLSAAVAHARLSHALC